MRYHKNISAQYLAGIVEGRKLVTWWKRDGFFTRGLLERNIASLQALRDRMAPLVNTAFEVEFFDGELDFYRNQLAKLA